MVRLIKTIYQDLISRYSDKKRRKKKKKPQEAGELMVERSSLNQVSFSLGVQIFLCTAPCESNIPLIPSLTAQHYYNYFPLTIADF